MKTLHKTLLILRIPTLFIFLLTISCENETDKIPKENAEVNLNQEEFLLTASDVHTRAQVHTSTLLFDGGTGGYHSFRIPCIVRATNGALIAFAEGRRFNNKDYGDINLVYKRSTDDGASWSSLQEVWGVGPGTWGNPTAVVDDDTGRIWLFMSWNSAEKNQFGSDGLEKIDTWGDRRVYMTYSDDHGISWAQPQNMTQTLLPPGYTWDAMGPGIGIQKKFGTHQGRLLIPAIRRNIYSDDHGQTWQYGLIPSGTSEGTIVERTNGVLIRNDRAVGSQWEQSKRRRISTGSIESGFSPFTSDNTLLDPRCQASILRYTGSPDRIYFLNPASTIRRWKMRVRISYDGGNTWPISRSLHDCGGDDACNLGKGGYSSMIKTADYMTAALVEINEDPGNSSTSHRSIEFHKFNLPWILNGTPEPLE